MEPELSKSLLFWARKQTRQKFALARLWALGSVPDCGPYWPLEQPASGFWTLQTLQNLAHLLDCGLWALCEAVGGVAQTVGSGLWRAKSFFSSGPKLPFKRLKPLKPLEPCQWFCHTGRWSSQLLDSGRVRRSKTSHLLDCGLWALRESVGGVAQTVGSGLWRAKSFFSSGPKLPFKRLKPLKPLEPCQWFCPTGRWSSQLLDSGRFRRSKTSHLLDCGLWALCETVGGVAQTVGSGLWRAKSFFSSGPKLPFKRLKPLKPLNPSNPSNPSNLANGSAILAVGAASFWILDASDAPKPRTCWTVGSGLCARLWAQLRRLWARGSGAPNPFF